MEKKVKLMCSYGGRIQLRPHHFQLSYFGGHTKILTVDRKIKFFNLVSKLNDLCECNLEIQVKYKLPGQDLTALISVLDDDDVDHMMFEYDLLRRVSIKPVRFRLFVFFPVTAKAVTARSLNPDFLFGFDKEYSFDCAAAVEPWKIPENPDGVTQPGNDGAPKYYPGTDPVSIVYRIPANAGGYFQTGIGSYNLYADSGGK